MILVQTIGKSVNFCMRPELALVNYYGKVHGTNFRKNAQKHEIHEGVSSECFYRTLSRHIFDIFNCTFPLNTIKIYIRI